MKKILMSCSLVVCFALGFLSADGLEVDKIIKMWRTEHSIELKLIEVFSVNQVQNKKYVIAKVLSNMNDDVTEESDESFILILHDVKSVEEVEFLPGHQYEVPIKKEEVGIGYATRYVSDEIYQKEFGWLEPSNNPIMTSVETLQPEDALDFMPPAEDSAAFVNNRADADIIEPAEHLESVTDKTDADIIEPAEHLEPVTDKTDADIVEPEEDLVSS